MRLSNKKRGNFRTCAPLWRISKSSNSLTIIASFKTTTKNFKYFTIKYFSFPKKINRQSMDKPLHPKPTDTRKPLIRDNRVFLENLGSINFQTEHGLSLPEGSRKRTISHTVKIIFERKRAIFNQKTTCQACAGWANYPLSLIKPPKKQIFGDRRSTES